MSNKLDAAIKVEADYQLYMWREYTHAMDAAVHSEVLADDIAELIFMAANKLAEADQDAAMKSIGRYVIELLKKESFRLAEHIVDR